MTENNKLTRIVKGSKVYSKIRKPVVRITGRHIYFSTHTYLTIIKDKEFVNFWKSKNGNIYLEFVDSPDADSYKLSKSRGRSVRCVCSYIGVEGLFTLEWDSELQMYRLTPLNER